jgi:hypothetical protein
LWHNISDGFQNSIDILFEAKLEHLVSFVKNQTFEARKVNVASFNVIKNSSCGTNKDVYTLSELSDLFINVDSSIHCDNFELIFIVFQFGHFSGDLERKLSSWR